MCSERPRGHQPGGEGGGPWELRVAVAVCAVRGPREQGQKSGGGGTTHKNKEKIDSKVCDLNHRFTLLSHLLQKMQDEPFFCNPVSQESPAPKSSCLALAELWGH